MKLEIWVKDWEDGKTLCNKLARPGLSVPEASTMGEYLIFYKRVLYRGIPWSQVLYLHMRLKEPDMISGAVSYEQRYAVSSWASEEPIDDSKCPDGCTSECDVDGQCVALAQEAVTDRIIQCKSNDQ